jgi:hypothetical protein
MAQFYGRKSKVMIKVPLDVKKAAARSLEMYKDGFQGGLKTGHLRAKQLATQPEIPIEDLRYMHAWFSRHVYASQPSYEAWKLAGRPSTLYWKKRRGILSWMLWAGDPGLRFVNMKKNRNKLEAFFGRPFHVVQAQ